jgi:hypothetical protein
MKEVQQARDHYEGPPYPVENYHSWCCEWKPRCDQNPVGTGTVATHGIDCGFRIDLFCEKHAKMVWEQHLALKAAKVEAPHA